MINVLLTLLTRQ